MIGIAMCREQKKLSEFLQFPPVNNWSKKRGERFFGCRARSGIESITWQIDSIIDCRRTQDAGFFRKVFRNFIGYQGIGIQGKVRVVLLTRTNLV